MLIKKPADLRESDVTPKELYLRRREFLAVAGSTAVAVAANGLDFPGTSTLSRRRIPRRRSWPTSRRARSAPTKSSTPTRTSPPTTTSTSSAPDKADPAKYAHTLKTAPVERRGRRAVRQARHLQHRRHHEVGAARGAHLPASLRRGVVDGDAVDRLSAERVPEALRADARRRSSSSSRRWSIRGRCRARPSRALQWPYVEGLRMDEAMHPLTLLGLGLYGEVLPNQNGAPIRLVVPWKYGFKSIKSIVRVSLRRERAAQHLEAAAVVGVRLLRQRQSAGRSPALVAGQRAPPRRVLPAQDADVQRLRRPGRVALRREWTFGSSTD